MPFRTRYGRRYHDRLGCHGATMSCGTGGLSPCHYCAGKGGNAADKGGKPRGPAKASSAAGVAGTVFDRDAEHPLAGEYARNARSAEVTSTGLPEHYHETRFGVPGDVVSHALSMTGMEGLSDLDAYPASHPGVGGESVASLLDAGDRLGAVALVAALKGAGDEAGIARGGWAVVPVDEVPGMLERLGESGVGDANAFKLPGGLRLVSSLSGGAIDPSRGRAEMTGADVALAFACTRRSANGPYQLVHYDQIACYVSGHMGGLNSMWDAYEGFLAELRGTVYDTRDMSVVSNPYYKFRNLNECDAYSEANVRAAIDANGGRMVATEKLDGSLIQLRYVEGEDRDGGAWRDGMLVTTSNTLDGSASAPQNSHLVNVRRMYIHAADDGRYRDLARAYPGKTLCFEFVRPDVDPHVVTYDREDWGLWLTGMRDVETGCLSSHEEVAAAAERFGIPHPKVVATDFDECMRVVREGSGSEMEGMVTDIDGWLVKMKLDDFLSLSRIHHSLEGNSGFKDILRMTHEGTIDDAMGGLPPESREAVDAIVARAGAYQSRMSAAIDAVMAGAPDPAADRRAFAQWVSAQPIPRRWRQYLFGRADNKPEPVYYADGRGGNLSFVGRNEMAEREAELADWLSSRGGERP